MTQKQFETFEGKLLSSGYKRDASGIDCDHTYVKKVAGRRVRYVISIHFRFYNDSSFTDSAFVSMWVTFLVNNSKDEWREMTVVSENTNIYHWEQMARELYQQHNSKN